MTEIIDISSNNNSSHVIENENQGESPPSEKRKNRADMEQKRKPNPVDKLVGLDGGFSNLKSLTAAKSRRCHSVFSSRIVMTSVTSCLKGDPVTPRGKRIQTAKVVFFVMIPVLFLVAQNISALIKSETSMHNSKEVAKYVLFSTEIGRVTHYLQIERGTTAFYIGSKGTKEVYESLNKTYINTNAAITSLTRWQFLDTTAIYMVSKSELMKYIQSHRDSLKVSQTTIEKEISFYTGIIKKLIGWVSTSVQRADRGSIWKTLVAYHMLILSKEQAGVERALGSVYFAKGGGFKTNEYLSYVEKNFYGKTYIERCIQYSPNICKLNYEGFLRTTLWKALGEFRSEILQNENNTGSVNKGDYWFKNMTEYMNILKEIEDDLSAEIVNALDAETTESSNYMTLNIIILVIVLILAPVTIAFVFSIIKDIHIFATDLKEKSDELELEKLQTTQLLYQMLPKSVATKLKNNEPVLPESYDYITLFFSDIVGFTEIATELRPAQIVEFLNALYRTLDVRIELYDAYKVETIGDAYMVVSGCPERNDDNHAREIGSMALDLMDCINNVPIPYLEGERMQLRAGIHSGPCVAGVVGFRMPRYCLFGDTIYTASKIEAAGLPNKIHVSQSAYDIMKDFPMFTFEDRGFVKIRGKCHQQTYWLLNKDDVRELSHVSNHVDKTQSSA